jgi:uncharacterized protein (DUF488 family)
MVEQPPRVDVQGRRQRLDTEHCAAHRNNRQRDKDNAELENKYIEPVMCCDESNVPPMKRGFIQLFNRERLLKVLDILSK